MTARRVGTGASPAEIAERLRNPRLKSYCVVSVCNPKPDDPDQEAYVHSYGPYTFYTAKRVKEELEEDMEKYPRAESAFFVRKLLLGNAFGERLGG